MPTRHRRTPMTQQESKLRPALKKVTNAVKGGTVKVLKGYIKGTNALADKLKPALMKLPKLPQGHRPRKRI